MLTPVRRRLAAAATVLLVPVLGGCNFGYQTDQLYQPAVGVDDRAGPVDVLGAVVVSDIDGKGTFVASLVNTDLEDDDTLTEMTGEDVEVQITEPIDVPADTLVNLADTGAVSVEGEVAPGGFVRLTLTFESGQETEVNVPVVDKAEEFDEVEMANPSSPSSTPTP